MDGKDESKDLDVYKLSVEIGDTKLKFQCPDRKTLDTVGIELLARTFGRYNADEILKKIKVNEKNY